MLKAALVVGLIFSSGAILAHDGNEADKPAATDQKSTGTTAGGSGSDSEDLAPERLR